MREIKSSDWKMELGSAMVKAITEDELIVSIDTLEHLKVQKPFNWLSLEKFKLELRFFQENNL